MLIAGYLKEDFIRETLKCEIKDLSSFLNIFRGLPYIICIKDPNLDIKRILIEASESDCIGSREIEWRNLIKELIYENRFFEKVKDDIYKSSMKSFQFNNKDKNYFFLVQSLIGKTYSLSFQKDEELNSLGNSIIQIQSNIPKKWEENENELNLRTKNYKNKLFYEKIAGYTCFYDTIFVFDQYITEPCLDLNHKCTKRGFLNMSKLLAKSPFIKNIIICAQDWWKTYQVGDTYPDLKEVKKVHSKNDVINSFIKELRNNFEEKRKISINLFLLPPSVFINEHERYIAFTELKDVSEKIDLNELSGNFFLPLELAQGFDYFKKNPIISAKVKYATQNNFKKVLKRFTFIKAIGCEDIKFLSFKDYWLKQYGLDAKLYIHHNEI